MAKIFCIYSYLLNLPVLVVKFEATIEKFGKKGEKTGWTYITIPDKIAQKIHPGNKKSFRVKGQLDHFAIKGVSLLPMGDGDFIIPVNAIMRKGIKKTKGEKLIVQIELDHDEPKVSTDLMDCLKEEKTAMVYFNSLPKSHQNYFSKWIESAKTDATKAKRIAQSINGLKMKMGYPEMLRYYKTQKTS